MHQSRDTGFPARRGLERDEGRDAFACFAFRLGVFGLVVRLALVDEADAGGCWAFDVRVLDIRGSAAFAWRVSRRSRLLR